LQHHFEELALEAVQQSIPIEELVDLRYEGMTQSLKGMAC